jgi:nucleotide-binding universal stress UspA family protein
MKKIVIATDGSETGRAAVRTGLELAADEGAEVVFAHVVSILEFAQNGNGHGPIRPERVPRVEDDAVLREALDVAHNRGIEAKPELLIGYPPNQILRLATDVDADLIVVGSRGLGRVKSAILGSTSREVLAHADRPVLVVREVGVGDEVHA